MVQYLKACPPKHPNKERGWSGNSEVSVGVVCLHLLLLSGQSGCPLSGAEGI